MNKFISNMTIVTAVAVLSFVSCSSASASTGLPPKTTTPNGDTIQKPSECAYNYHSDPDGIENWRLNKSKTGWVDLTCPSDAGFAKFRVSYISRVYDDQDNFRGNADNFDDVVFAADGLPHRLTVYVTIDQHAFVESGGKVITVLSSKADLKMLPVY